MTSATSCATSTAPPVTLKPGAETVLEWRLPEFDGQPIAEIGAGHRRVRASAPTARCSSTICAGTAPRR